MIYRRIQQSDYPQVQKMLHEHSIVYETANKPLLGFVAIGDSGELVGFIFAHQCLMIEPFVVENATAGVKLNYMMEGAISALGVGISIAHIKNENEKLDQEIRRTGFQEIDTTVYKLFKKVSE